MALIRLKRQEREMIEEGRRQEAEGRRTVRGGFRPASNRRPPNHRFWWGPVPSWARQKGFYLRQKFLDFCLLPSALCLARRAGQREYVATLKSREEFRKRMCQLYHRVVGQTVAKTVVIGDGAHWIWSMAQEQFPGSIEILDFFHLSEYIWAVAKAAYPKKEQSQKYWVKIQQQLLKKSQWQTIIKNCHQLRGKKKDLTESITNLERYLNNNQSRIDYQSYLKAGLMIGSGVVESSNRRVVTQRLKQAGMHWSKRGAEGVMALRAAYLSNSNRWSSFWSRESTIREKLA